MSLLEEKANEIVSGKDNPTVAVDPATIIAVIGLIVQVVKLYKECKKTPEEAKVAMASPGFFQRLKLKWMARRLPSHVVAGVLDQGKTLSVEEVERLFEEVA